MDPGVSFVPAEFWGVKVAPKKSVTVGRTFSANEDELDTYHLSQVALGPNADSGRHVVFIEYEGQKNVIGSLALGKTEQFQIDFPVNCELTVSHSGKSDVYVTGYTTRQYLSLGTSSDEEGEWESGSHEEPLPLAGKQLPNGPRPAQQQGMRTLQRMAEDSSEADESEEDSDDDEGAAAGVGSAVARHVQAQAHQFSDMDDDSDEDESDEDEGDSEDDDEPAAAAAGARAALGKLFDDQADEEEEEDSDEEDSDEDEDEDDDEESDEDVELKPAPKVGAKRGAAQATTPQQQQQQPQKKAKATADTPGSPGTTAKYQADLVQYLKSNGATKLAVLGSQVKRAPGLPKMKKFLEDRPAVFKLDAQASLASLA